MSNNQKPVLYSLCNTQKDNLCFSPFVWRTQLCLKLKNIEFEDVKLTFTQVGKEITQITKNKWKLVPTLKFSEEDVIFDSREIAIELEKRYPDGPKLFPNGFLTSRFLEHYIQSNFPTFIGLIGLTEVLIMDEDNKKHLEPSLDHIKSLSLPTETLYPQAKTFLKPISLMLKDNAYIEGNEPTYSDFIVFGFIQWMRVITPVHYKRLIEEDEHKLIFNWFEKILDLYDGYGRSFPVNTIYGDLALQN